MSVKLTHTVWLNEGASDGWNGLWHYYHFAAENILAGFASLATTHWDTPVMPKQLVIPFYGDRGSWHDKWGMNEMVVDAVFREDVIEPPQWARLEKKGDGWVYFDRSEWAGLYSSSKPDTHTPSCHCRPLGGAPQDAGRGPVEQDGHRHPGREAPATLVHGGA